jgi:oxygen-dependent protoporphyrinogen oxidase
MTAVSIASAKWPHVAAGDDDVVLRVSLGRYGNDDVVWRTDDELVTCALDECARTIGMTGTPSATRVVRWVRSFPQYTPGHIERVQAIRSIVAAKLPGVWLAGAAYDGIGVPACIRQGNEVAAAIAKMGATV